MIGKITGTISHSTETFAIVDVAGVGYKIFLTSSAAAEIMRAHNHEASLWTHLVVRENALDLYGFQDLAERELFEQLIGVSGIGPKSAIAVLGLTTVETLKSAIASGETSYLTKVSGIGRKSAEKIIIELKDKFGKQDEAGTSSLKDEAEALEALQALGYSAREAREALKQVPAEYTGLNERMKRALKVLSGR